MSTQYPGGFISKSPALPNGSTAGGIWTLNQQAASRKANLWPTTPGAPTSPVATAPSDTTASVSFVAPSEIGSSAITSYTVTSNPGNITASGVISPITVTGLTTNTAYTFTVTATNGAGTGPASVATNSVTPLQPAVEDVFSTWLYTGNSSTQTITNGINLSGQGGLVWLKERTSTGNNPSHWLFDTVRGGTKSLTSDNTGGNFTWGPGATFSATGFSIGNIQFNTAAANYASWTFREEPKFFDIVAYTGDGASSRTINHNLGVEAGMVIVKRTDSSGGWKVWHRSISDSGLLNSANLFGTGYNAGEPRQQGYISAASSTTFTLMNSVGSVEQVNASGGTYIAYVFAHNTATDSFIQCDSFTPVGSPVNVTLGWEPQWVLVKDTGTPTSNWQIFDNMRGFPAPGVGSANILIPNSTDAETANAGCQPTSTGFIFTGSDFRKYIYIAIRRGPMKTPTVGTSVFSPIARTGTGANATVTAGFAVDFGISAQRAMASTSRIGPYSKLQGAGQVLNTTATSSEDTRANSVTGFTNTGILVGNDAGAGFVNESGQGIINWFFQRAPGFCDEVCYTGTGSSLYINHNLGVAPELMIIKSRNAVAPWGVYAASEGISKTADLNTSNAFYSETGRWLATPTATQFSVKGGATLNSSGQTQVAYLFASCPGVSKIGSYTGNGSSQTINCAFTTGARFVLIKRSDSGGDWYVWDSARGIVAANDPYLALNSTAAEVTTNDSVDTDNTGFIVNQVSASNINVNGATYIFLAVS